MAATDQNVINFARAYLRPMAAERLQDYYSAKKFISVWGVRGITAALGTPSGAIINDGANQSGNNDYIITDNDMINLWNRCNDIITDFEATSNAKLNQLVPIASVGAGGPIF
jgi:hypothetical protein